MTFAGPQSPRRLLQPSFGRRHAGKNGYWYATGSLSEPIFDAGRLRSNYHLSQAQEQEMLLDYQKTILNALKDVSDSLVG